MQSVEDQQSLQADLDSLNQWSNELADEIQCEKVQSAAFGTK